MKRSPGGDGLPDIYEWMNGTNPYVADYSSAPRIVAAATERRPHLFSLFRMLGVDRSRYIRYNTPVLFFGEVGFDKTNSIRG